MLKTPNIGTFKDENSLSSGGDVGCLRVLFEGLGTYQALLVKGKMFLETE